MINTQESIRNLEQAIRRNKEKLLMAQQLSKLQRTVAWRKCIEGEYCATKRDAEIAKLISPDANVRQGAVVALTSIADFNKFVETVVAQASNVPVIISAAERELARLQGA